MPTARLQRQHLTELHERGIAPKDAALACRLGELDGSCDRSLIAKMRSGDRTMGLGAYIAMLDLMSEDERIEALQILVDRFGLRVDRAPGARVEAFGTAVRQANIAVAKVDELVEEVMADGAVSADERAEVLKAVGALKERVDIVDRSAMDRIQPALVGVRGRG